jgi:hypothetical protein
MGLSGLRPEVACCLMVKAALSAFGQETETENGALRVLEIIHFSGSSPEF